MLLVFEGLSWGREGRDKFHSNLTLQVLATSMFPPFLSAWLLIVVGAGQRGEERMLCVEPLIVRRKAEGGGISWQGTGSLRGGLSSAKGPLVMAGSWTLDPRLQ